ncbi:OmpA/MotB family protein [Pseudidiomarina woesei]|uniref:OmpA/MotB family protein n=1 Tax=Pseudidiomarina woesei TaxID=1381080 RepID=UPI0006E2B095|nr:OmpA family protein [Pseudidiomarina woesei]
MSHAYYTRTVTEALTDTQSSEYGLTAAEANADLTGGNQQDQYSTMPGQLEQQMASSGFGDNVEVSRSPGKINIKLSEKILFDSGEASFNESAAEVMAPIIDLLAKNRLMISVEGHTDNIPISTAQFPSNWELSAASYWLRG